MGMSLWKIIGKLRLSSVIGIMTMGIGLLNLLLSLRISIFIDQSASIQLGSLMH